MPTGPASEERLINLYNEDPLRRGNLSTKSFRWHEYQAALAAIPALEELVAHARFTPSVRFETQVEEVWGELVSGNYFDALKVTPVLGRLLQTPDDNPGASPVVVLGHAAWKARFGGALDVVGSTVQINGRSFEVVGVAPRTFRGTFAPELFPTALWVPLARASDLSRPGESFDLSESTRGPRWLLMKGRLNPGVSFDETAAQVAALAANLDRTHPLRPDEGRPPTGAAPDRRWTAVPSADISLHGRDGFFRTLAGAGLTALILVVLMTGTNAANLTLARMHRRRKEIWVRRSLGASHWRILGEQLAESAVLCVTALAGGLWVAYLLLRYASTGITTSGRSFAVDPSFDAFLILAAVTIGAAFFTLFCAIPIVGVVRDVVSEARHGIKDSAGSPDWRTRKQLISVQVALSVVLLVAGIISALRVDQHLQRTQSIDAEQLALLQTARSTYRTDASAIAGPLETIATLVASRPGIDAVTLASGIPTLTDTPSADIVQPQAASTSATLRVHLVAASPNFFSTVGLRITRGTPNPLFTAHQEPRVAAISNRLAQALFHDTDALGRTIEYRRTRRTGEVTPPLKVATVVGIVEDVGQQAAGIDREMALYVPLQDAPAEQLTIIARSDTNSTEAVATLSRAARDVSPTLPIAFAGTAGQLLGTEMVLPRLGRAYMSGLGAVALVLALVGLYGILTFVVRSRRREIGIRMALGASERQVVRLILLDGWLPVGVGLLLGVGLASALWWAVARVFLLEDSGQLRMLVLATVATVLGAAGYVACRIPARRAVRVAPSEALRHS